MRSWLLTFALLLASTNLAWAQTTTYTGSSGWAVKLVGADQSTAMTDIGTTPTQVTAFTESLIDNSSYSGFTVDAGFDTITVLQAGTYFTSFQISFSGTGNSTFHCHIYKNTNTAMSAGFMRKLGATGDVGSASAVSLLTLAANDTLMLKCAGDTAGDDMTPVDIQLVVLWIS